MALIVLSQLFKSFSSLDTLSLYLFIDHHIKTETLVNFVRILNSLKPLKEITITFHWELEGDRISENKLMVLSKCLRLLNKLQKVSVDFFSNQKIRNPCLISFSKSLKYLKDLQRITIPLYSLKINNIALMALAERLQSFKSLKHISIRIEICKHIKDNGVLYLIECLEALNSLESLCLDYSRMKRIESEKDDPIIQKLKTLKSLKMICYNKQKLL